MEPGRPPTIGPTDVKDMFTDIDAATVKIIAAMLKVELLAAIKAINADPLTRRDNLAPAPINIFNAFRQCPIGAARVCILAQDPYPSVAATGLAFAGAKLEKSLAGICKCLINCGLMREIPTHGDLTSWAAQGILLLNSTLTVRIGKANSHEDHWKIYTEKLIKAIIIARPNIIFIALGNFAQEKLASSGAEHILRWNHPSPISKINKDLGDKRNFLYCDCFTRANKMLVARDEAPIDWDFGAPKNDKIVGDVVDTTSATSLIDKLLPRDLANVKLILADEMPCEVLPIIRAGEANLYDTNMKLRAEIPKVNERAQCYLFVDGGALANGMANCVASFGWLLVSDKYFARSCGNVRPVDVPDKVFKSSNNRGELSALAFGLRFALTQIDTMIFDTLTVVYDSDYAVKCTTVHARNWFASGEVDRLNIDLIAIAREAYLKLNTLCKITFQHIKSHKTRPTQPELAFKWDGNTYVDFMCNDVLGIDDKKKKLL